MKRVIVAVLVILAVVLVFRSCYEERENKSILKENSMLIQQQIKNVYKLIVTEGHFAEVYNYKDSQELFGPLLTANKKALVVVNAEVTVGYDLSKLVIELDEETKTVLIKSIPEPEIKIHPDFEYYDVTADYFNPFSAKDYNTIKKNVRASLLQKVEASTLKSNAKNRLFSELSRLYVLTNSMGWVLEYKGEILEVNALEQILKD